MKTYIIVPSFEMYGTDDARTSAAISLAVDIVLKALRAGSDTFQFAVSWVDPGKKFGEPFHSDLAEPHVHDLQREEDLRAWLCQSVDPNIGQGGDVRSIATCRTATFGYDGQTLLLLRHEDAIPISPDPTLIVVEERPELLLESDYFDGWARD